MVSDRALNAGIILAISVGLAILVYGMWLSHGQSWNQPTTIGGVLILAATAILTARIARIDEPAH